MKLLIFVKIKGYRCIKCSLNELQCRTDSGMVRDLIEKI
jgi:hypothetical protein